MRQEIQQRMNESIRNTTLYNELFDLVVSTTETSFNESAVMIYDNGFRVEANNIVVTIICNDNAYNTISVSIDYTPTNSRIADLDINIQGVMNETYHTIPKACRAAIYGYANDLYDALEEFINTANIPSNIEEEPLNE